MDRLISWVRRRVLRQRPTATFRLVFDTSEIEQAFRDAQAAFDEFHRRLAIAQQLKPKIKSCEQIAQGWQRS